MTSCKIENLIYSLRDGKSEKKILKNISFELNPGEITCIWGPNGAGKTSLANCIALNITDIENSFPKGTVIIKGNIYLDEQNLKQYPSYFRAKIISKISQDVTEAYSPSLTLRENLVNHFLRTYKQFHPFQRAVNNKDFNNELISLVSSSVYDFKDRLDDDVSTFSGGEAEFFSFYSAVLSKPKLLILDEHTKKLDLSRKEIIEKLTVDYIKKNNIFTLWITHDPQQIINYADTVLWLKAGEIIEVTKVHRPFNEKELFEELLEFQKE